MNKNKKRIELAVLKAKTDTEKAELRGQLDTRAAVIDMSYGLEYAEWRKQSGRNKSKITVIYTGSPGPSQTADPSPPASV